MSNSSSNQETPRLLNDNEIIIVDDDEMEIELARRFYAKSDLNNPLLTFSSGEEFLAYLDPSAVPLPPVPALVLMDVRMPRQNGFDVVAELRQRARYAEVPIVSMFTNSDDIADREKAESVGADYYVVKPASGKAFVAFFNSLGR